MKIFDRYLAQELLKFFLLVLAGGWVIMTTQTLATYVQQLFTNGASLGTVVKLIAFDAPRMLTILFPVCFMGSVLLAIGRLGKDSEITALRSAGVGYFRVVAPILVLSMWVSALDFLIAEFAVPYAFRQSADARQRIQLAQPEGRYANNRYFKGNDNRFYNVASIDRVGKTLSHVLVFDNSEKGKHQVIVAKSGSWEGTRWMLREGVVQDYDQRGFVSTEAPFQELAVDTQFKLEDRLDDQREPKELSMRELGERIAARKKGGLEVKTWDVEYHFKLSQPMACFFAALIAAPLGLRFARFGSFVGGALAIILIFVYFVSESIGRVMGNNGLVPPYVAAWLYNLVFFVAGVYLIATFERR